MRDRDCEIVLDLNPEASDNLERDISDSPPVACCRWYYYDVADCTTFVNTGTTQCSVQTIHPLPS
jgi:hypothetical protein